MRHRGMWAVVLAAAVVVVSAAMFGWARLPSGNSPQPTQKLRIALSSTPHAALLHLAAAKGYFAEQGLDVTVVPVTHGKAALEQLSRGAVDLAAAAEVPFVIAVLNGEPLSIAATVVTVSSEMAVVARRDRGIAAARDLAGKRVGVTLGTSGEYYLWAFLIRNKLRPDGLTLVDVAPGQIVGALSKGMVDAVATWQPLKLNAQNALGSQGVSFTEDNVYTTSHVIVGRSDYLKSHPEVTQKLLRATLQAERFQRTQPREALALAAQRLAVDAQLLKPSWQDLDLRVDLAQSQLVTLEDEARWAAARGYSRGESVPNFLPHLYLDGLLAVQPERVTVVH